MNVSLQKTLFSLVACLLLVGLGRLPAQTTFRDTLDVLIDSQGEYYFEAYRSPSGIFQLPQNGTAVIASTTYLGNSKTLYKIIYTPKPGFLGNDSFTYNRMTGTSFRTLEVWEVLVRVKKSEIRAEPDLFYVPANSPPVSLDVLTNDFSNAGGIRVNNISTVNNGSVNFTPGSSFLQFTPTPGFSGTAQLNYTVCDRLGVCDQASVSIAVVDESKLQQDTLRLYTRMEESLDILVPDQFLLLQEPQHGIFDPAANIPVYYPTAGFTGKDYLRFSRGNNHLLVELNVLNARRNKFAVDDQVRILPGGTTEIDLLANDGYGYGAGCVSVGQPKYGNVIYDGTLKGQVVYQAPAGFSGVDQFTYSSMKPGCSGAIETAIVYVYVSNYEPAYTKFLLRTPHATPLKITHNAPIKEYNFKIEQQGQRGRMLFLQGNVDTLILGQRITGYNLLLYVPTPGETGLDEVEITYCIPGITGGCTYRKSVKLEIDILNIITDGRLCVEDCIWAGDTNNDGIVNMEDLLPIGLFMGEVGKPRSPYYKMEWFGKFGPNWANPYADLGYDLKHIDSDGDSLITALDTTAIREFYGLTHALVAKPLPYYNFNMRLEGDVSVKPGDMIELNLVIGDNANPVLDLYGFTFSLPYNTQFFKRDQASLSFASNSWLSYNSPVVSMSRNDRRGLIEAGFTRTNGLPVSGFGKVGTARFIVVEDISGIRPTDGSSQIEVEFGGLATGMSSTGQAFGIWVEPFKITIDLDQQKPANPGNEDRSRKNNRFTVLDPSLLKVFPNPSTDWMNLYLNGGMDMQRIQVFNIAGQLQYDSGDLQNRSAQIPVGDWREGIYIVKAFTSEGVVHQKFEVIK
ncbi:MAG: T9SS type A sorting domain-containing protein [Lewinellaceae bacterium]|nr:T9SS type A sorting domain-containing protein [Lewinellaceae bacterium]